MSIITTSRSARPGGDPVNSPTHYTSGPQHSACGQVVECIDIARTKCFTVGNAIKYVWRKDLKGNTLQDLHKAAWYLQDEISRTAAQVGSRRTAPAGDPLHSVCGKPIPVEDVASVMSWSIATMVRHLWHSDRLGSNLADLCEAHWYLQREIAQQQDLAAAW